jgi:autotransporter-associated beta strand protein
MARSPNAFSTAIPSRSQTAPTNRNVNITVTGLQPGTVTVNNNVGNDYTFSGVGGVQTDSLTKSGGGMLTLANTGTTSFANVNVNGGTLNVAGGPYNLGSSTIGTGAYLRFTNTVASTWTSLNNSGTVQIGDGVTPGVGNSGTNPIVNNNFVVFNRPDDGTVANPISGGGQFIKTGAGVATLSGNSTYTGETQITQGTVKPTVSGAFGDTTGGGRIGQRLAGRCDRRWRQQHRQQHELRPEGVQDPGHRRGRNGRAHQQRHPCPAECLPADHPR